MRGLEAQNDKEGAGDRSSELEGGQEVQGATGTK